MKAPFIRSSIVASYWRPIFNASDNDTRFNNIAVKNNAGNNEIKLKYMSIYNSRING